MDNATARKHLEEIRHDLDKSITVLLGDNHRNGAVSSSPADPADAGANLSEADRSQAVLEAAQRQRTEVLAALTRLDDGAYGQCVDCGDSVPEGRLEAKPEAARCVRCQSKRDKNRH
ncbi:MAG TPA: TraR/DksA family transcriptional regulator [Streptosporangiaceae bacterium]|nr:TraR/DksA family transcriptional regulator [Streptosporangiaceae bacterium]